MIRFGHTLIPPGMYRRDKKCNYLDAADGSPALRLCATWWDAQVGLTKVQKVQFTHFPFWSFVHKGIER